MLQLIISAQTKKILTKESYMSA